MMKDKEHVEFIKAFEYIVNSITLIDIPNQDGGISKNEFKEKISNLNFKLKISDSIDGAIHLNSKDINTITLVTGSLYLIGEDLNLN